MDIVKFYCHFRDDSKGLLQGSFHLSIVEKGIELRGCIFKKKGDKIFFSFPRLKHMNMRDRSHTSYPAFSFSTPQINEIAVETAKNLCAQYVEKYLKDHPFSIVPNKKKSLKKKIVKKTFDRKY
jgi:hypothetical protein